MLKEDLIAEVQKEDYKSICKKMLPELWKDLYQDLTLIILEKPQASIDSIKNSNSARFYLVGILCNMVRSNTSPFYRNYRNTYAITNEVYDVGEHNHEKYEKLDRIKEEIDKQYWFDKEIIKQYIKEGSIRKTMAKTGISQAVVVNSINAVKKKIKQSMTPIKILLITTKHESGLKYHRQLAPHARLTKTNPEFTMFKMDGREENGLQYESSIDDMPDEHLREYNIVYYLRQISFKQGKVKETIDRCHKLGVKVVLDIDDNWRLNSKHIMYDQYKSLNVAKETEEALRLVDHVITTTDYFAEIIKEFNKNVTVLPNCVNPDDGQYHPREIKNERLRFGWIGGVYHREDIDLVAESFCRIAKDKEVLDKFQVCLGGYNVSHTSTGVVPNMEYHAIEKTMTCNYNFRYSDSTYMEYLYTYTPQMEHISYDKPFRRLWAKDVFNYATLYNEIDVALVPLISNEFNRCKSELKIVEAGHFGKAVIISDTEPYKGWIEHGKNGLVAKGSIDWYVNMKKLIKEPELRKDLSLALKETIDEYFVMCVHIEILIYRFL